MLLSLFRELQNGTLPWPLFLFGRQGRGKSCAIGCLGNHFGGWYTKWVDFYDLLNDAKFRRLQRPSTGYPWTSYEVWQDWTKSRLTMLDDLGTGRLDRKDEYDWMQRATDLRTFKPAVYISNLGPDELKAVYDDRIVSRIVRGTVAELTGPDRRIIKEPAQ